jgi:hypothetical protein
VRRNFQTVSRRGILRSSRQQAPLVRGYEFRVPPLVFLRTYCSTAHNPHSDRRRMHPLANLGGADEFRAR